MRLFASVVLILFTVAEAPAQGPWEQMQTLPGVWSAAAAFGDYTGDGLPDLVLTGQTGPADGGGRVARVYRNINGALFAETGSSLIGVAYGSVGWADYDGDGDLDLALSGMDDLDLEILRVYRNDNGILLEDSDQSAFVPVRYAALAWGDYDNDGDPDLVVSGMDRIGDSGTILYRNQEGRFDVDLENTDVLVNVNQGALAWGDYDNDDDLDLVLTGFSASGVRLSRIYKNQPLGTLRFDRGTDLTALSNGSVTWADYDADGDVDLFTSGRDATWNARFIVYNNRPTGTLREGTGNFTRLVGAMTWGDYDNQGQIDAVVGGRTSLSDASVFFLQNNPSGMLSEDGLGDLQGLSGGAVVFADVDGDGDLDLLSAGENEDGGRITALYRNGHAQTANQSPTPPTELEFPIVTSTKVTFTWEQGDDNETEPDDLTYDLQVGNSLGADRILSSVMGTTFGNVGHGTNKVLTISLPEGQYSWRVRSVDNNFQRSSFSAEGQFLVQTFVSSDQSLSNLTRGAMAWGDYDNDGDPDLVITGQNIDGETETILYENRDGVLTENTKARIIGLLDGDLAWIDYDNDGDLDLTITGADRRGNAFGRIYRNDVGTFILAPSVNLPRFTNSRVALGDYDNDGDFDVAIMGRDPVVGGFQTRVYRNEGKGSLVEDRSQNLTDLSTGDLAWGDYDKDGDVDLLVVGQLPDGSGLSRIYKNDPLGTLTEDTGVQLEDVRASSAGWGDYDNDGDLDLSLCGFSTSLNRRVTIVYENSEGSFTSSFNLTGVQGGSLAWGDFDNDGDPDLVVVGNSVEGQSIQVYRNNGTSFDPEPYRALQGVDFSTVVWGDGDGDGDLDLATLGRGSDLVPRAGINDNLTERVIPNKKPDAPAGLTSLTDGSSVTLSWDAGQDINGTPAAGLTYTLRVGRSSGGHEVVSGIAQMGMGNGGQNRNPSLRNLESDFYFWSVRTVDAGFGESDFAAETRFIIDTVKPVVESVDVLPKLVGLDQDVTVVITFFDNYSGLNKDVFPEVSFSPDGGGLPRKLDRVGFLGDTPRFVWTGRVTIPEGVASGPASVLVSGAEDVKGNRLDVFEAANSFTIDAEPPTVVSTLPEAGQTGVPRSSAVRVIFNETMDDASLTEDAFLFTSEGAPVPGTFNYDPSSRTLIFQPGELSSKTTYEATVFSSVRDSVGNRMPQDFRFTFQTAEVLLAQEGGTIRNADGSAALYAPPRAFAQDQELTIVPLAPEAAQAPPELTLVSAFQFGDEPLSLAKPSTLTLSFTDLPSGASADRLAIYRRNAGSWTRIGGSLDASTNSVSTVIEQLGVFGLFEDPSAPTGTGGPRLLDCQPRVFSPGGGGFKDVTDISFGLTKASPVTIHIYNRMGLLERLLRKNTAMNPGINVVTWNGRDNDGKLVPSGLYIVVLMADGLKSTRTVGVLRN